MTWAGLNRIYQRTSLRLVNSDGTVYVAILINLGSSEEGVYRVKNGNIRARGNLKSKLDN